eukprot:PhM_4_TR1193/c0_g1_i1/m.17359
MSWQGGSSIFRARTKGRLYPQPHRKKMPWLWARETVPNTVLHQRDRSLLDGTELPEGIERVVQKDPLDVLKYAVARHDYDRSTGQTLFQLAAQLRHCGRGQKFYRAEWMQGTYEKFVTLSALQFDRNGSQGKALGYYTFHGESSLRPMPVAHADSPGWFVDFREEAAVAPSEPVPAPPSIGTEIPVDPATYRLKSYPCYDPPNPTEFVEKLLQERGVIPSVAPPEGEGAQPSEGGEGDGSEHYSPK